MKIIQKKSELGRSVHEFSELYTNYTDTEKGNTDYTDIDKGEHGLHRRFAGHEVRPTSPVGNRKEAGSRDAREKFERRNEDLRGVIEI